MKGYNDVPVLDKKYDIFEVGEYVDSLSQFVEICSSPMTIAIQGDWGSGKTSFMNMIKNNIEDKVSVAWFNTWQFSQFNMGDDLPIVMISYFIEILTEGESKKNLIKKMSHLAGGIAKIGLTAATEQVLGGAAAESVKGSLEGGNINHAKIISELKNDLEKAVSEKLLADGKDRLVIFIDDLDRIQPEKAVELLEILKVFMDIDNSVYVLAVDYKVVSQGISSKFGNNVSEEKGKSFFDKIIQLPFKVPVNQYNIIDYIKNLLSGLGIDVDDEQILAQYEKLIRLSVGRNPRSIKRIFNSFMLIKMVAEKKKVFEKEVELHMEKILFAILCMQLQYEELYTYISNEREQFDERGIEFFTDLAKIENLAEATGINDNAKLSDMVAFIELFNEIIQLDDDLELTDDEKVYLQKVLNFSSITSKGGSDEYNPDNDYWRRRHSKWLANDIQTLIMKKFNQKMSDIDMTNRIYLARNSKIVYLYTYDSKEGKSLKDYQGSEISLETSITVNSNDEFIFNTYVRSNPKKGNPIAMTDFDLSKYTCTNENMYHYIKDFNFGYKISGMKDSKEIAQEYFIKIVAIMDEFFNHWK